MAAGGMIGNDGRGPVAESVDAGAVQCSLSWFKSRPGLQPSLLTQLRLGEPAAVGPHFPGLQKGAGVPHIKAAKMPVDGGPKTLSRLRNLV